MKQQSIECHIAIGQLLKAAWCKCLHTSTSVCKILRHYCVTLDFIIVQKSKNWYDVMRRNCKFLFTALGPLTFELCSAYLRGIKTDRKQFRAISNWFRQICKYKNKKNDSVNRKTFKLWRNAAKQECTLMKHNKTLKNKYTWKPQG